MIKASKVTSFIALHVNRLRKMRGEFSFMPPGGREKGGESRLIADSRCTNNAEYFNKIAIELLESFINIKREKS